MSRERAARKYAPEGVMIQPKDQAGRDHLCGGQRKYNDKILIPE